MEEMKRKLPDLTSGWGGKQKMCSVIGVELTLHQSSGRTEGKMTKRHQRLRKEKRKQATHMLARCGHRLVIDRETNFTAQLGKELFIDPRSGVLAAGFRWILARFGTRSARMRGIRVWIVWAVGVAGFRLGLDFPICHQSAGITPRALLWGFGARIAAVRIFSAGGRRERGTGTTGVFGGRGVGVCRRVG